MFFWDYDTQWGADRSRMRRARDWGHLEFSGTDELLELHARFGVPACFAVVGAAALPGERPYHDPAQIRRIHAAGHEIASHAFKHEWLPGLDRRALLRTLRDSKDALEQCIGAPVVSFVPPFNQPFHYARGWSFSVSELREAGVRRTTLDRLCDALRETGYTFCRVAYAPLTERAAGMAGMIRGRRAQRIGSGVSSGPAVTIAGVTCVRVGPCGFGTARVSELCQRAASRARGRTRRASRRAVWTSAFDPIGRRQSVDGRVEADDGDGGGVDARGHGAMRAAIGAGRVDRWRESARPLEHVSRLERQRAAAHAWRVRRTIGRERWTYERLCGLVQGMLA